MSRDRRKTRPCSFAVKPTSVVHRREIARRIDRSKIDKLNKALELQIGQNQKEQIASMDAAARCVVGGNFTKY